MRMRQLELDRWERHSLRFSGWLRRRKVSKSCMPKVNDDGDNMGIAKETNKSPSRVIENSKKEAQDMMES